MVTAGRKCNYGPVVDRRNKFQPCRPTFVQARNAMLLADIANNKGANYCAIWHRFASVGYVGPRDKMCQLSTILFNFNSVYLTVLQSQLKLLRVC